MVNSFHPLESKAKIKVEEKSNETTDNQDLLMILKRRLAKGEIDENEYERIRKIIGN